MVRSRAGFTLIELLVVVAIIALLISILLPSLSQAKEKSRTVVCASNLHQLGLALQEYTYEEGYYPGHHTVPPVANYWIVWPPRLRKFTSGEMNVFNCPTADDAYWWKETNNHWRNQRLKKAYGYYPLERPLRWTSGFAYGYNDWGVREFTDPHLGLGGHVDDRNCDWCGEWPADKVKLPAEMIAIADSKSDNEWDTAIDPADWWDAEWPSQRHTGGAEVLFCDGHVIWMERRKLIEPDDVMRSWWNNDHEPHREYW